MSDPRVLYNRGSRLAARGSRLAARGSRLNVADWAGDALPLARQRAFTWAPNWVASPSRLRAGSERCIPGRQDRVRPPSRPILRKPARPASPRRKDCSPIIARGAVSAAQPCAAASEMRRDSDMQRPARACAAGTDRLAGELGGFLTAAAHRLAERRSRAPFGPRFQVVRRLARSPFDEESSGDLDAAVPVTFLADVVGRPRVPAKPVRGARPRSRTDAAQDWRGRAPRNERPVGRVSGSRARRRSWRRVEARIRLPFRMPPDGSRACVRLVVFSGEAAVRAIGARGPLTGRRRTEP